LFAFNQCGDCFVPNQYVAFFAVLFVSNQFADFCVLNQCVDCYVKDQFADCYLAAAVVKYG
jgi:hypothetical protein